MSSGQAGTDTIFYTLTLKRTKTPSDVFEKMKKQIKRKGATARWSSTVENGVLTVDFGDGMSECLCLSFDESGVCKGCCKVCFPMEGDLFEDEKKSEYKALLNMLLSVKSLCSSIELTDDYGIAADYADSKKYKLSLRELTGEELALAQEIHDSLREHHLSESYPNFLLLLLGKALGIPVDADYNHYISGRIMCREAHHAGEKLFPLLETYLYETSEFRGKRLSDYSELEYITDTPGFAVMTFLLAANELYCYRDFYELGNKCLPWGRYPQLHRFYRDKVYPLLDALPDGLEKDCLAFRYFQSAFDFCGFRFVGK